jgi:hypothetical protein
MADDPQESLLKRTSTDRWAAIGRAFAGALPYIGPSIQELLTATIPNQRLDRIIDSLQRLERRLSATERELLERRITSDRAATDLLEEGMVQATRAVDGSRREHIAALLASTLTAEELEYAESLRLWSLLDALNDVELLILQSYGVQHTDHEAEFQERHGVAVAPRIAHTGSTPQECDAAAVYNSYLQHLVEQGLLRPRFRRPRRGEVPEFDDRTGMMKAAGHELTSLGRLLLRRLDLPAGVGG